MNILSRSEEIVLLAVWKLLDNAFGTVSKPLKQLAREGFVEKSSGGLVAAA